MVDKESVKSKRIEASANLGENEEISIIEELAEMQHKFWRKKEQLSISHGLLRVHLPVHSVCPSHCNTSVVPVPENRSFQRFQALKCDPDFYQGFQSKVRSELKPLEWRSCQGVASCCGNCGCG